MAMLLRTDWLREQKWKLVILDEAQADQERGRPADAGR